MELAYDIAAEVAVVVVAAVAGWYSHWKTEEGSVFASFSDIQVEPAAAEEQNALYQNKNKMVV